MRGNDIKYNPVFFSYAIFVPGEEGSKSTVKLYITSSKVADEQVQAHIKENGIEIYDYADITEHLKKLAAEEKKIGFDENSCNQQLYEAFKDAKPIHIENVVQAIKAVKNPVEMEGMRRVNIKNCASLVQFFAWMEDHLAKNPDSDMTEYTAAKKLEEFRKTRELYMGPSFDTISSMGPNGAVIHYKPEKDTALKMNNKEIYLLDSGVQYLDGTTDITRSVHFGGSEPTAE